jgi:hypothetical protein
MPPPSTHAARPPSPKVAAGSTTTWCMGTGPQLYGWGKLKASGDNTTYPQPMNDLSGWNVSGRRPVCTWPGSARGSIRGREPTSRLCGAPHSPFVLGTLMRRPTRARQPRAAFATPHPPAPAAGRSPTAWRAAPARLRSRRSAASSPGGRQPTRSWATARAGRRAAPTLQRRAGPRGWRRGGGDDSRGGAARRAAPTATSGIARPANPCRDTPPLPLHPAPKPPPTPQPAGAPRPQCDALEGIYTRAVACGSGFTLFLVEPSSDKLDKMPLHEPEVRGRPAPRLGPRGGALPRDASAGPLRRRDQTLLCSAREGPRARAAAGCGPGAGSRWW